MQSARPLIVGVLVMGLAALGVAQQAQRGNQTVVNIPERFITLHAPKPSPFDWKEEALKALMQGASALIGAGLGAAAAIRGIRMTLEHQQKASVKDFNVQKHRDLSNILVRLVGSLVEQEAFASEAAFLRKRMNEHHSELYKWNDFTEYGNEQRKRLTQKMGEYQRKYDELFAAVERSSLSIRTLSEEYGALPGRVLDMYLSERVTDTLFDIKSCIYNPEQDDNVGRHVREIVRELRELRKYEDSIVQELETAGTATSKPPYLRLLGVGQRPESSEALDHRQPDGD